MGTVAAIAMIAAMVACQAMVIRQDGRGSPDGLQHGQGVFTRHGRCICEGDACAAASFEELCCPAEGLSDGVARQLSLVGAVPRHLPRLPLVVGVTRAPVPAPASTSSP